MKKLLAILAGLMVAFGFTAAHADDAGSGVDMPQVSSTPSQQDGGGEPAIQATNPAESGDYQRQILSNPTISGIGRAESLTHGGGNTAIVVQKGHANHSTVRQSGNDNYVSHTQNGDDNDIAVDQKGKHNRSVEHQTGNHNRKIIIQNGKLRDQQGDDYKELNDTQGNDR